MGEDTSEPSRPLLHTRDTLVANHASAAFATLRLYDPVSTLNIRKEVAEGYLVLLSGGLLTATALEKRRKILAKQSKQKKSPGDGGSSTGESSSQDRDTTVTPDEAIHLAFVSITDGNVVESTFGVSTIGGSKRGKNTSCHAFNEARAVKEAIRDSADFSDSIPRLAVETYMKCFEILIDYHDRIDDLGLITWCYKHQVVEKDAFDDLEEAFLPLLDAVEAII